MRSKKPIDILKGKIVNDANAAILLYNDDVRTRQNVFNIYQVILKMVRDNEALDNVIIDINNEIGIYTDDIRFYNTSSEEVIDHIKKNFNFYMDFCTEYRVNETYNNLWRLKNSQDDNAIFKPI